MEMAASPLQLQEVYEQQGFLSALPVLNDAELTQARNAFSELEDRFGEKRDVGRHRRKRKKTEPR